MHVRTVAVNANIIGITCNQKTKSMPYAFSRFLTGWILWYKDHGAYLWSWHHSGERWYPSSELDLGSSCLWSSCQISL